MKSMKIWKKQSAVFLALLLLCSIAIPASAADASEESLALYEGVESLRMEYESDIDMSMIVMGEKTDMGINIAGDLDRVLDPERVRMTLSMSMPDDEQEALFYYEKVEDGYRVVVSNDGGETWSEQFSDAEDLPGGAGLSKELMARLTDLAQVLPEAGEGNVKGIGVTLYSGILTGKDASDLIAAAGALSMLENSMDMDLSLLDTEDLGSLPVSIAVDRETGFLMQYELDLKEIEQNLMNRLVENLLRSELEGEELPEGFDLSDLISVDVSRAVTSTVLYDYNQVGEITIPEVTASAAAPGAAGDALAGDTISFGHYEQDNDTENGPEEIEWLVLAREGDRILVISREALDCQPYLTGSSGTTWETSALRTWLNGTFMDMAFTAGERARIPAVTVSADENPDYGTDPGNATQDQVFLLSLAEADRFFAGDAARQCRPTAYAAANGCFVNTYNENCCWWLRTPGVGSTYTAFVLPDGTFRSLGENGAQGDYAVRPALWIDLAA